MRPPVDATRGQLVRLRITQHWPIVALSFVPLLIFRRALLFGETLFYQDLAAQYFPREQLLMRTGATGWNPHIFLGMSLVGDPQTAAHEPVRALARLLGLEASTGLVFMLAVYLIVAGLGVYLFALRKGAAPIGAAGAVLAAIWGGLYVVRFRHPPLLTSMCMIPWTALVSELLLAEGTLLWALVLALIIAVGALGGGPQGPYMLWLFVASYLGLGVWVGVPVGQRLSRLWSLAWRLAIGAVAFLGLIAIQYLPVGMMIPQTARHEAGVAFVGAYSLSPSSWAHLVVPDLYGNDMNQT
ncbi:MAG TPA: hypothetical protein VG963_12220, partial [Polyangiaceae bacterium]|nr:hypothetical protein [Polyangiaceae bacterium]